MIRIWNKTRIVRKNHWLYFDNAPIFSLKSADFVLKNHWLFPVKRLILSLKPADFWFWFDWKSSKNVRCFWLKHGMFLFETSDVFIQNTGYFFKFCRIFHHDYAVKILKFSARAAPFLHCIMFLALSFQMLPKRVAFCLSVKKRIWSFGRKSFTKYSWKRFRSAFAQK